MTLKQTVCFVTLGCKVNQTESEAMAQLFRNGGYQIVESGERTDVVVVNTCTVTNTGDSKSRQLIRRMIKAHPEAVVVVAGCYAQTSPGEVLQIEGVDLVLGTQDRGKILEFIARVKKEKKPHNAVQAIENASDFEELPILTEENRTRATLKIQEGCNNFCTYCIIPYARGPVRSRQPEKALAEAQKLIEAGYREIVLTGIHTGAYGEDFKVKGLYADWDLARLIREMGSLPGLRRLRLSSIEPMEFTPELIEAIMTVPVVCPHVHIPLQSGTDTILARMKRPYRTTEYAELLASLRREAPEIAITTDVIVGFPGETAEEHAESLDFIQQCHFAGIHIFPFSRREGTPAASYPHQLPNKVKQERSREMQQIAVHSKQEYTKRFIGREMEVLIEQVDAQGKAVGHTANYLTVELSCGTGKNWTGGELIKIPLQRENLFEDPV